LRARAGLGRFRKALGSEGQATAKFVGGISLSIPLSPLSQHEIDPFQHEVEDLATLSLNAVTRKAS
jgi:hypothetical protein